MLYRLLAGEDDGKTLLDEDEFYTYQAKVQYDALTDCINRLSPGELYTLATEYEYDDLVNTTYEDSIDLLEDGSTTSEIRERLIQKAEDSPDILRNSLLYLNLDYAQDLPNVKYEKVTGDDFFPVVKNDTHLSIPKWLDDFCSGEEEKHSEIRVTHTYSKEQVTGYMKRYAPRTYAEGYLIVDNLLQNQAFFDCVKDKQKFTILDVGCGTGFATLGALSAIIKRIPDLSEISIDAIDGNDNMLNAFKAVISEAQQHTSVKLTLSTKTADINKDTIHSAIDNQLTYDVILCFKMVNELVLAGENNKTKPLHSHNKEVYSIFTEALVSHLSRTGIFVFLDISKSNERDKNNKTIDETDYHQLLSSGVRSYIQKSDCYRIIIPIPCAKLGRCERESCPTQRRYGVSNTNGEDSVTYFIISNAEMAKNIIETITQPRNIIFRTSKGFDYLCPENCPPSDQDRSFRPGLKQAGSNDRNGFDIIP